MSKTRTWVVSFSRIVRLRGPAPPSGVGRARGPVAVSGWLLVARGNPESAITTQSSRWAALSPAVAPWKPTFSLAVNTAASTPSRSLPAGSGIRKPAAVENSAPLSCWTVLAIAAR